MSVLCQKVVIVSSAWWWTWVMKYVIHQEVFWWSFKEARGGSGQSSNFSDVVTNSTRVIKWDRCFFQIWGYWSIWKNYLDSWYSLISRELGTDAHHFASQPSWWVSLWSHISRSMATYLLLAKKKAGCLLVLEIFILLRHQRWSSSSSTLYLPSLTCFFCKEGWFFSGKHILKEFWEKYHEFQ